MTEKEQELLRFVKQKHIWKMLLKTEFPEDLFKQTKKEYFLAVDKEIRREGVPRDTEVAKAALEHLLKIGYINNKDALNRVLHTKFFSDHIFNPEYYVQKLETMEDKPDLDLGLIEKQEYYESRVDEFAERVIKDKTQYIEEKIKEKEKTLETLESIPSILDKEQVFPEPDPVPESKPSQYDPWWKKLGLISDPFPSTVGIRNIEKSFYDEIIVPTEIYEVYVNYVNNVQTELFKNVVFYGEFGSGKTTLFQYLEPLLIKNNIYPAFIILYAELDYQNFLMRFKQKLCNELVDIYYNLSGSNLTSTIESMTLDRAINYLFKSISQNGKNNGFIIFIDDIYKPPEYENTALKFLNYLQTFRDELNRELKLINIGFFISAPPEWETTLREKQAYSGSISLEEHMPFPTVEQARTVFNQRLAYFSPNKEKHKDIVDTDSAYQVYRTLLSKKSFTFRAFITECLRRFRAGNFGRLTANPVSITRDTLKNISQTLAKNLRLSDSLNEILNSSMSMRRKSECIELLVQIFYEKGYSEDSEVFQKKIYYFDKLKNAGLITKNRNNNGKTVWDVSKELTDFNTFVYDKFAYYLDDYFLKLFEGRIEAVKVEPTTSESEEFTLIQALLDKFKDRIDTKSTSVRLFLDEAFAFHKEIAREIEDKSNPMSLTKLLKDCKFSIRSLSNSVATYVGMPANGTDFWNDYVHYPESLRVFSKNLDKQSQSYEPNTFYLHGAYLTAFREITRSFSEQIARDEVLPIPFMGIKAEEFKEFEAARFDNSRSDHISAARRTSTLVENKLREFIYSVFVLQYGDRNHRMQRIPIDFHSDIKKHVDMDKVRGFASSKNELTYLDRAQYYEILTGRSGGGYGGIGYDNWLHTFSKIFTGWDVFRMRSFLKSFYHFTLLGAHNKEEVLTTMNQSDINHYIMDSIKLFYKINQSYYLFLERVKKAEIPGSTEIGYYFQLDKDNYTFQPVRVLPTNRGKITELLKESRTTSIDLSRPSIIEQRYGIDYQEFMAILSDLLIEDTSRGQLETVKRNDPLLVLRSR